MLLYELLELFTSLFFSLKLGSESLISIGADETNFNVGVVIYWVWKYPALNFTLSLDLKLDLESFLGCQLDKNLSKSPELFSFSCVVGVYHIW